MNSGEAEAHLHPCYLHICPVFFSESLLNTCRLKDLSYLKSNVTRFRAALVSPFGFEEALGAFLDIYFDGLLEVLMVLEERLHSVVVNTHFNEKGVAALLNISTHP